MVSVDSPETNKQFAQAESADFPILSDPGKKVAEAYGVLSPSGYARRWTFYIGRDGKILAIDKQVNPSTSGETIAAKLTELGIPRKTTAPSSR